MEQPADQLGSEVLKLLVREVEAAKNRLSDRSGYSPAQRMIGETPKPTGKLLSDAMVEPALLGEGPEMDRKLAARKAAQKAFAEVNNSVARGLAESYAGENSEAPTCTTRQCQRQDLESSE